MTTCKSAKVINGVVYVGDKVINVPQGKGSHAFYGEVKQIYRMGVGCTWLLIDTPKGEYRYPASLLHKGTEKCLFKK